MVNLTQKEQIARNKLCLPLDVSSSKNALELVTNLHDYVGIFKVGYELVTNLLSEEGDKLIEKIQNMGAEVFLDLKYNDIPNTIQGAAKAASRANVYMFNLHASATSKAMQAAVKGAKQGVEIYKTRMPKILAVTMLTSIDDETMNNELRIPGKVVDQVTHYAKLAQKSGLDGVVCSAAEMYALKQEKELRPNFMYVTPGIQAIGGTVGADQKRIFTPGNAIKDGSTILVAGRTITTVKDPGAQEPRPATPDEMQRNAYGILQDMAQNL